MSELILTLEINKKSGMITYRLSEDFSTIINNNSVLKNAVDFLQQRGVADVLQKKQIDLVNDKNPEIDIKKIEIDRLDSSNKCNSFSSEDFQRSQAS